MTAKITIRRRPDGWHVTRPAFGFSPATTTVYPTGAAALASLTAPGLGSGSAVIDKGAYTLTQWSRYWPARPRWIGATVRGDAR